MRTRITLDNKISKAVYESPESDDNCIIRSSFTDSVLAFPTFEVNLSIKAPDGFLSSLTRGHKVSCEYSIDDESSNFINKFTGEINGIEHTRNSDQKTQIKISGQSPFARLQTTMINPDSLREIVGFRSLMRHCMQVGGVWGAIIFGEDVPDSIQITAAHEYPAFCLMKQLCLQRDLVFEIDGGDVLRISTWKSRNNEALANIRSIDSRDLISFKLQK